MFECHNETVCMQSCKLCAVLPSQPFGESFPVGSTPADRCSQAVPRDAQHEAYGAGNGTHDKVDRQTQVPC